jgi:hypothetical protein
MVDLVFNVNGEAGFSQLLYSFVVDIVADKYPEIRRQTLSALDLFTCFDLFFF